MNLQKLENTIAYVREFILYLKMNRVKPTIIQKKQQLLDKLIEERDRHGERTVSGDIGTGLEKGLRTDGSVWPAGN